ncbi:SPOR domain-containing protein [Thiotrichales bacterium 19S3-7]|nr:SPOR domain-containing protein [Thiotrichales bacterium 19S3-7]MCF6802827.1 SPOR domain-containing protein [Thiotrichales bacterium 19S3-11]
MVIRDYAKHTVTAQSATKQKKQKTATRLKKVDAEAVSMQPNQGNVKKVVKSRFNQLSKASKNLTSRNTNKSKALKTKRPSTSKTNYKINKTKESRPKFNITEKAKSQLTSVSVFIFLGIITLILLLLLFYVMSHKKTTELKEITLPKPASFLNPPSLDPNKAAPVITIPIGSGSNTPQSTPDDAKSNTPATEINKIESTTQPSSNTNSSEPKFTFYDTLTKQTVQVDATPKIQPKYQYTYALQVASYKNLNDANSMRARLLLIGLKPTVAKKGSYYTVSIGGITTKRDGDIIKHKLESNNIQGSMLIQTSKKLIRTENT